MKILSLLPFLLIVAAVSAFGAAFPPGDWYAALEKPWFTPPNWLFPIAWTLLYIMIAIAGWLIFASQHIAAKYLWAIQLFINAIWSWLFFGLHNMGLALADIILLDGLVIALLISCYKKIPTAFYLLVPYCLWILFASILNLNLLLLNS